MRRGGQPRWNNETQRWEDGTPPPAPYTGPMPPRPALPPPGVPGPFPEPELHPGPQPQPYPQPHPEARPAPGRRTIALVAGAAVAVIAAAAGGGYLLWGRGDDPAAARPPARGTASAPVASHTGDTTEPTGASPSVPPTDSSSATGVPAGYRIVHDTKGFTTAVPEGWQRSERSTGVFYTAPDDRGLVQIFQITEPDTSPREALQQASRGLSGNPGYEEISLGPLSGEESPGMDAAQLVYAYDSERIGTRVKVVDCAFTVADGRQFAVLVLGTEADWPEQERTQQIALRAFAPTR
ncbi:hypothetical protein AB0C96_10395 [Streptomyces sp. NPDC048506]|uniref:hypothetical protein n=1 Tax=Streptomyces sp. NPDC048506 TaxID=3155028 RepID=UPI00341A4F5D